MASLSSFIIKRKLTELIRWPSVGKFLLAFLSVLFAGLAYGYLAGFIADTLIEKESITQFQFIVFYTFFLGLFTLMIDFFPFMKHPYIFFKPYHPVHFWEKIKISLVFDWVRNFSAFLFLMQGIMVITSKSIDLSDIYISSLLLINIYALNRLIRNNIYFDIRNSKMFIASSLILILLSFLMFWKFENSALVVVFTVTVSLTNLILYFYSEYLKREKVYSKVSIYRKGLFFRILDNKNVKVLLIISFVFKIMILLGNGFTHIGNGKFLFGSELFFWLFLSPIALFTYIGYNFFGINRKLFLTHAIRENSFKGLVKLYSTFYFYLFIIDAAVSIIYSAIIGIFTLKLLIFYLTSFALLFFTAYPLALLTPVIKEKYYSIDFTKYGSKTISLTSLITGFIIMGITITSTMLSFYWVIYSVLIISIGAIVVYTPFKFSRVTQKFYSKIKR